MMPSCEGRIVTAIETPTNALRACADSTIMRLCREAAAARLKTLKHQKSELNYYMRVHSVHDYGYQDVATLDTRVCSEYAEAERVLHIIDSITAGKHGVCVKTRHEYTATYRTEEGKLMRTRLRFVGSADGLTLLQTADGKTPEGVATLALLPWNASDIGEARAVGFPDDSCKRHRVRHGLGTHSSCTDSARRQAQSAANAGWQRHARIQHEGQIRRHGERRHDSIEKNNKKNFEL